jgi:hypothetical protein
MLLCSITEEKILLQFFQREYKDRHIEHSLQESPTLKTSGKNLLFRYSNCNNRYTSKPKETYFIPKIKILEIESPRELQKYSGKKLQENHFSFRSIRFMRVEATPDTPVRLKRM